MGLLSPSPHVGELLAFHESLRSITSVSLAWHECQTSTSTWYVTLSPVRNLRVDHLRRNLVNREMNVKRKRATMEGEKLWAAHTASHSHSSALVS